MAFRELHVVEIKEVLRRRALGRGCRCVAERTGGEDDVEAPLRLARSGSGHTLGSRRSRASHGIKASRVRSSCGVGRGQGGASSGMSASS